MRTAKKITSFFVFICSLPGIHTLAQTKNISISDQYRAIHWNVEDSLPSGHSNTMLKDANGFLWIGSAASGAQLCRFDGTYFKIYQADKNKKGSINSGVILSFHEDSLHNIWMGTERGLSRYDIWFCQLLLVLEDLRAVQAQLIQSEKMASLGELTSGIAHEIQNPLNFVNNFSELNRELIRDLKAEVKNRNFQEADALADCIEANEEKINHHGKRADGIVKSMLQHSRTRSGQSELTDLNALCDEYIRLSYHGYRAKDRSFKAKFETDLDSSLPKIKVVPRDIGRVVLNLVNNAFYAVGEKESQLQQSQSNQRAYEPTVKVRTKMNGDMVIVSVEDNGNGIADHIKEKIFQPFFTTKPTGKGTGLGLSISYDIVKAHGGELALENLNEGTKFVVSLPSTNRIGP